MDQAAFAEYYQRTRDRRQRVSYSRRRGGHDDRLVQLAQRVAPTSSIPFYVFNDTAATVGADRSRDTTGYNPRSNIIEGGSWTRVELHREHWQTVLLAA